MIRRNVFNSLGLVAMFALAAPVVHAQDIHFTQFDAAPLVINPAFTGMFDGQVRAAAIYRNQWASVTVPYVTYGASVDLPVYIDKNGDYLATGLQLYKDQAGDGNLSNFTGMVSLAYHKFFGVTEHSASDLAVGLQGGYTQESIDLSKLYFGDEYVNGTFVPGTSQEYHLGIGNSVNYYLVNAGISFSQSTSDKFGYVVGVGANNINQPNNDIEQKASNTDLLAMRYTGEIGANWLLGSRFSLRPAVLYQSQATANEIVAGNEFHYQVGEPGFENFSTAVFVGAWYRTGDAVAITAGVEFKGFRIGVAYDYNVSTLNTASNGNGGIEIAIKYIAPNPLKFAGKRTIPCSRF